jgi:Tol biopolymer transport system component
MVAVSIRDFNRKRSIWVYDLTSASRTRITQASADETNAVWSEIGFSSDRRGHRDMYVVSASGTGQERTLLESSDDKTLLDWSRDGRLILYSILDPMSARRQIWELPLTGGAIPVRLDNSSGYQDQGSYSPNGHWVFYRAGDRLRVQQFPASSRTWPITPPGRDLEWRGDSRELFYIAGRDILAIDLPAEGPPGTPQKLFPIKSSVTRGRNRFVVPTMDSAFW